MTGAGSGLDAIEAAKCSGVISVGPGFHPLSAAKLEGFVHQRLANAGNKMRSCDAVFRASIPLLLEMIFDPFCLHCTDFY